MSTAAAKKPAPTFVWMRQEKVVVPFKALVATSLYCAIGGAIFSTQQGLSPIDSVYFMCVTLSTVGYGDISPTTPLLKGFILIWIFVAIVLVFPLVTGVVSLFTQRYIELGRLAIEKVFPPKLVDVDGDGVPDFKVPDGAGIFFFKNMMPSTFLMISIQLIAAAGFVVIEGWDYGDAFYHCIVTATTVGYGDMSISTESGRIWACVQILISVAMLGELVSTFDAIRAEYKEKRGKIEKLQNKLNPNLADNLLATIDKLQGGESKSDSLSQTQFLISMLVQSGAIPEKEVESIKELFDRAEVDSDGNLSKAGLTESISELQAELVVAAVATGGETAKLAVETVATLEAQGKPLPPPMPKLPKKPSAADREKHAAAMEKRAEAKAQRRETIRVTEQQQKASAVVAPPQPPAKVASEHAKESKLGAPPPEAPASPPQPRTMIPPPHIEEPTPIFRLFSALEATPSVETSSTDVEIGERHVAEVQPEPLLEPEPQEELEGLLVAEPRAPASAAKPILATPAPGMTLEELLRESKTPTDRLYTAVKYLFSPSQSKMPEPHRV